MRSRPENILLTFLIVINAVSIFGFATFGLHPELLSRWPWSVSIFAVSYPLFARLQILVAFASLAVALSSVSRWRWWVSFAVLFSLSAASELLGTTYGIPFGRYEYTEFLGPAILGRVPWLIPLSWFFMAVPSYRLAQLAVGEQSFAWLRVVVGSLLLLSWDITLDPAMSHLSPFWRWENPGAYYGIPARNLLGWFVTGLVLISVLESKFSRVWLSKVSSKFLVSFYLANLVLPVGMCVAAGLWLPVAITSGVAAALGFAIYLALRRELNVSFAKS
ncbi:MAG: carotenoid biosynthesis protein [Methylotenera sp.]|nr:carotenoid biosynthesis protein [Oligoflexia bacterium]